ncbi:TlpA family protein disulfide reductase [Chryseobacterium paridis]|uniref:TlpA family protein disulfide reductase n=1 Tax=Chryseobacterium paridis TaxID=2800328 RepID=A0ABS1FZB9_9FLAO|nr:TlpA disulfide reductase family protein [Chryseobacterium paridis]MBK1897788.1 TlpA family protein disulfide reductase [Chryseobacterium paridis]
MKRISQIVLLLSFSLAYSQTNFKMEISAPDFEKDSISIGPIMGMGGIHTLYKFVVNQDKNVRFMKSFNSAFIRINDQNVMTGQIDYPQPILFSYFNTVENGAYGSDVFFIESGNYKIKINNKNMDFTPDSDTPTNIEYKKLKKQLEIADKKLKPFVDNNPINIEYKEKLLRNYILKNKNSYVAFWEIVSDYSKYGFNRSYVENMPLFSKKIKETFSYQEFDKILKLENSTNVGATFPDLKLNSTDKISKSSFSDYKLTLIDYWATTCKPCIKDLPKLVSLHENYKSKGVQFISVADDTVKDRMDRANKILGENKVTWKNYFDLNKEFPAKLHATGYPLQILVDQNGKIIARKFGELDQIAAEIEKHIQ